jgi:hypothetical protein
MQAVADEDTRASAQRPSPDFIRLTQANPVPASTGNELEEVMSATGVAIICARRRHQSSRLRMRVDGRPASVDHLFRRAATLAIAPRLVSGRLRGINRAPYRRPRTGACSFRSHPSAKAAAARTVPGADVGPGIGARSMTGCLRWSRPIALLGPCGPKRCVRRDTFGYCFLWGVAVPSAVGELA